MSSPEFNPEWATEDITFPDGTPNKIRPDPSIRANGYAPDQYLSAQELNWQMNNLYEQIVFLKSQIAQPTEKAIGEIVFIADDNRNPAVIYGYGSWEVFAAGQVVMGAGTHTDVNGETRAFVDGAEGGTYRHQLTTSELPRHQHSGAIEGPSGGAGYVVEGYTSQAPQNDNYRLTNTGTVGGDQPHNNMQPYVACYIWKRVA